jgi:hypothetical protein
MRSAFADVGSYVLLGGKRVSYGARAMTAGGPMSLPKLVFPGGALVRDNAGFLNAARIKSNHAAIQTSCNCTASRNRRHAYAVQVSYQVLQQAVHVGSRGVAIQDEIRTDDHDVSLERA